MFAHLVVQDLGHGYGTAREVRIEVLTLAQHYTSWWIMVAGQQRKDVVLAALARRHDVAQIRWIGTIVSSTRRLLIGIRRWEVVRQLAGTIEVVARIIGTVSHLVPINHRSKDKFKCGLWTNSAHRDLLGLGLGLSFGMADANQIAVGNVLHRVAGGAHLLVHLVAATHAAEWNT